MKQRLLFSWAMFIFLMHQAYGQNYTLEADSIVKVSGQKICTILKTKKNNLLLKRSAEYTVYDVNGTARFLLEGFNGNLLFLDDNTSFIPKPCVAHADSIARLFASDSILSSLGYNNSYRSSFIALKKGYDHTLARSREERNKTAPILYLPPYIIQDNCILAIYETSKDFQAQTITTSLYNKHRKMMFKMLTYQVKSPITYIQTDVYDAGGVFLNSYTNPQINFYMADQEYKKGVEWLILKKGL